jgi:hypothetical protein
VASSTQALYKLIDSKRFYMGDYAVSLDTKVKKIKPHLNHIPGVCINGFIQNKQRSMRGLLLFQNGIYNMLEGTFQTEVKDPQEFVLRNMIQRDFPVYARRE